MSSRTRARRARAEGPGPSVGDSGRVERIITDDGVRLALHVLGPESGAVVLLVPGTFSNHTFWLGTRGTGFARELALAGFLVCVLDPRGHGGSDRPQRGVRWTFEDWARRDVAAAIRWAASGAPAAGASPVAGSDAVGMEGVRAEVAGAEVAGAEVAGAEVAGAEAGGRVASRAVWAIGHSAGGAAVLTALAGEPSLRPLVRGGVILATPVPWLQGFRWAASRFARLVSRLLGRFPARRLGLGPEDELAGVMIQWMTWNIEGHWRGAGGTDYEALLPELRLPLLFIAGSGDRVEAPPRAVRALHDLVGSPDRDFILCGRDTGFSEDFDHAGLVVSRAARTEVWPIVLGWLREREGSRAG